MKRILLFAFSAFLLAACSGKTYVIDRTSAIPKGNYEYSFALQKKEFPTNSEKHLEKIIRKSLLKSKWRFDDQSPDYIITVSQDSDQIHINLLEAETYVCKWQGRVFTPQKELTELQLNRVVLAALR